MTSSERVRAEWVRQAGHDVRFEWGPTGTAALADDPDRAGEVVVVVDVLRFTTAVDAAVSRGIRVLPYRWKDPSVDDFAARAGAAVADGRDGRPSLSPVSLLNVAPGGPGGPGGAVVLPSPNGATCAAIAAEAGAMVLAACLRNAHAVAAWLGGHRSGYGGGVVTVVACGERWPDGSLRPAIEDLLGAGALIARLPATWSLSPEAALAAATWTAVEGGAAEAVAGSASGREALSRGWADDLSFAVEIGASTTVPILREGAFVDATG